MAVKGNTTVNQVAQPVKIKFDGSYIPPGNKHGNGPSAAVGYVITDRRGNVLARDNYALRNFISDNTHVEYRALVAALKHAADLQGVTHVCVLGDSRSVIDCVREDAPDSPNDKSNRRYVEKARVLMNRFDHCRIKLFDYDRATEDPRDKNERADNLAKRAHEIRPWESD